MQRVRVPPHQYPARDGFQSGECAYSIIGGVRNSVLTSASLESELKKISTGGLPEASFAPFSVQAGEEFKIFMRGLVFNLHSPSHVVDSMFYYGKADGRGCGGRFHGEEDSLDESGSPNSMLKWCSVQLE